MPLFGFNHHIFYSLFNASFVCFIFAAALNASFFAKSDNNFFSCFVKKDIAIFKVIFLLSKVIFLPWPTAGSTTATSPFIQPFFTYSKNIFLSLSLIYIPRIGKQRPRTSDIVGYADYLLTAIESVVKKTTHKIIILGCHMAYMPRFGLKQIRTFSDTLYQFFLPSLHLQFSARSHAVWAGCLLRLVFPGGPHEVVEGIGHRGDNELALGRVRIAAKAAKAFFP